MTCLEKAYRMLVEYRDDEEASLDLDEVIGYLGEALDDQGDTIEAKFTIATPVEEYIMGHSDEPSDEPSILDSGDRTQFESGAVRDMREGKGRCDLMPLEVAAEYLAMTYSSDFYTKNILKGIADFQKTGGTHHLYTAIGRFATDAYGSNKRCDTTMLLEVAKHFEEGAKKYGENNWQKGIPVHCYIDSAVRHYLKWLRGDKDEPHDRAFVWNLMCCIWEVDCREVTK